MKHEFMHGLGFYSGWNEYLSASVLTPDPSPLLANQLISMVNPSNNAMHPNQFLESAMDRLLRIIKVDNKTTSIPISDYTKRLNKIEATSVAELMRSPAFQETKDFNKIATEAETLGIHLSSQKNPVTLETSLRPFQPGSSISHVSLAHYSHTPDFLMRFMQDRGLSLEEAVKQGGGTGPIGPLLMRIFEEIGYSTVETPDVIPPLLVYKASRLEQDQLESQNGTQSGVRRKSQHHRPNFEYASAAPTFHIHYLLFICPLFICNLSLFII